jgi:uncharacterized coiled-coil protein SlyX
MRKMSGEYVKFDKAEFVKEVRKIAHSEPPKEVWQRMYDAYKVYKSKTILAVLNDFGFLAEQKSEWDKKQETVKMLREKFGEAVVVENANKVKPKKKGTETL